MKVCSAVSCHGPGTGSHEHRHVRLPSCSLKGVEFLDLLSDCQLTKISAA
jgi:hypothetical protein